MLELVLKITSMVVTAIATIVKIIDLLEKTKAKYDEHQKSNRTDQS